jgi:probable F420-dependent oxidoreductase
MIKFGVVYPQTEYPPDPAAITEYARQAERLGYNHVLAYSHVLGANPERPGGWQGPYTHAHPFIEPLLLFSYMAAHTERLEFTTGIIILPQRQTALFAKQAATLDVLCDGRLRIGIGIGWNRVEYQALGEDFHNRGVRVEEQVTVLKELWTKPLVDFKGRWHDIPDAGINPLPIQRPIPIWFGGHHDNVLRRIARLGDGWMPNYRTPADAHSALTRLRKYLADYGRDPADIGIEARISYGSSSERDWERSIQEWRAAGATHISINTMGLGFEKPSDHISALEKFAAAAMSQQS